MNGGGSGKSVFYDRAIHVGQAVVAAGVSKSQLLVVQTQQVQDRGVFVLRLRCFVRFYKSAHDLWAVAVLNRPAFSAARSRLNQPKLRADNDLQKSFGNLRRTGRRLNRVGQPRITANPSKKPTAKMTMGLF